MKKLFLTTISIFFVFVISACNMDNDQSMEQSMETEQRQDVIDQLNPNRDLNHQPNSDIERDLGYVHYTKGEIDMQKSNVPKAKIDRSEMADMITRLILTNDGFNEVATLVTDQEVLIAFDKTEKSDAKEVQQIAKKTAESVMPRFYDIHVTDNKSFINDIQSLHNSGTNRDYDHLIQKLIKEMNRSGENE